MISLPQHHSWLDHSWLDHSLRHHLAQSGVGLLVALPPIVQAGELPAPPPSLSQMVATFEPARPGQEVVLERRTGHKWKAVARADQDRSGAASFEVKGGTFRASTKNRRAAITTSVTRARTWRVDFEDTFDGRRLDQSVWNDQESEHASGHQRTCARADSRARRVKRGVLRLGIRVDPETTE